MYAHETSRRNLTAMTDISRMSPNSETPKLLLQQHIRFLSTFEAS